jgi:hypothetical protein
VAARSRRTGGRRRGRRWGVAAGRGVGRLTRSGRSTSHAGGTATLTATGHESRSAGHRDV